MSSDVGSRLSVVPGEVLAGKYRVERVIGSGGMSVVVAAHHVQLDEKVALKFLAPEMLRHRDAVTRFLREARAAVKIKSEHVARVTDVGTLDGGVPYMVMEYLEGADLAAWLQEYGRLPVEQAIDFVLQACVAVAEAHALGIIHRDLKPSNLFCIRRTDKQFCVKVLDFGISKIIDLGSSRTAPGMAMTRTSTLMGSPLYMSPEQMRSAKDIDVRTDIWALGVILFELISGRPPFMAEAVTELAIKVANDPAPSLRAFTSEVTPALEAAILRCLEKDVTRRYPNVGELALAISPWASVRARSSVERITGIFQPMAPRESVPPRRSERSEPPHVAARTVPPEGRTTGGGGLRRRTTVLGGGLLAALGIATAGSLALLSRTGPRPTVPTATATASPADSVAGTVRLAPVRELPGTPDAAHGTAASAPAVIEVGSPSTASPPPVLAPAATVGAPRVAAIAAPLASGPVPATPSSAPPRVVEDAGWRLNGYRDDLTLGGGPNCDPPYYVSDAGTRVFKRECL